ncbi:MAG: hypothetical protein UZ17_ACD001001007 [Acidobacteria bacterium OLB17]|nr:MAG: hypothetical protein UZ17_ACD001001007 [Acidobacteria bacterium OLB17]MCZ2391065.1 hypothetical protein [Acidobacteriota bacterium]
MEYEIDKQIDRLLRNAGNLAGVQRPAEGPHLDADQLSAFLESALPETARRNVITHAANCDECRQFFAAGVEVHAPASAETPAAAPTTPIVEPKRRWRFLGMPAFAAVMSGLLVVVFAGFLGLRYFSRAGEADFVAKKAENEAPRPAADAAEASNTAAQSGNPAPLAANIPANTNASSEPAPAANRDEPLAGVPVIPSRSFAETPKGTATTNEPSRQQAEITERRGMPMLSQAPPKPAEKAEPGFQIDGASGAENKVTDKKLEDAEVRAKSRAAVSVARDASPERPAAPPAVRSVSGKTFTQRGGVWYDSAYKGGKTVDRAKKCDTCGALAPGLQKILDTLPGTVVVVWNGRDLKFF